MRTLNLSSNAFFIFWISLLFVTPATASGSPKLPQSSQLKPITVQVNWNHQFQFAGFYAAIKQGYYQQAGLDVTINAWQPGMDIVDEVLSGRADFATGYSSVIADYAKGKPLSLVMVSFQFSPMILLSHEPVYNLEQLSGKSVMHFNNLQINGLIDKANILANKPLQEVSSSGNLNDFIDRKVDLYAAYKTNEPFRLFRKGVSYYTLDPKTFGVQSYGDLIFTTQETSRLLSGQVSAFKSATIRGWEYAITHQAEVVDYILANYSVVKDRDALLAEAEATTIYVKSGHKPIGQVEVGKLLASAEQAKESGLISQQQLDKLDVKSFIFNPKSIYFTPEERDYLKAHTVIKVANNINWEPFEFIDESGQWSGIAAEYFQLIEKQLGVKFEFTQAKNGAPLITEINRGEFDVLSSAVVTEERQQYLNFTSPFLSFPMVLTTLNDVSFIEDVDQLRGKKLAVGKAYGSHSFFRNLPSDIDLVLVDSTQEGLEAIISGKAFAYAGNVASINFTIKKHGFTNLHIAGQLGKAFDIAIGIQKSEPILFSIFNKALADINETQRSAIYNNWIKLEVLNTTDRTVWIQTLVVVTIAFIALLVVMTIQQIKKSAQQAYIKQINELSMATYTNIHTGKFEWVSDRFAQLSGYDKSELLNQAHDDLRVKSVDDTFYDQIWTDLRAGKTWQGELKAQRKDGSDYWVDLVYMPEIVNGKVKGFWATRTDITDKKHLQKVAILDALTGVFNRHHFNAMFEAELNRASRKNQCFTLARFDIDFFKEVKDYYGHQKSDELLIQVVNSISTHTKCAGDLIFRVGSEEFMIFCELDREDTFFNYLELLRESVEALAIQNPKAELKTLSISIGGVFCQQADQTDSATLYAAVDKALYEAKYQGRNQVVMHIL